MIRAVLFLLLPVVLVGCNDHHTWRQALTILIETPDGPVTGRSVQEIKAIFRPNPLMSNEVTYRTTGEATAVEVAKGRYLFVLIPYAEAIYRAAPELYASEHRGEWLAEIPDFEQVVPLTPRWTPWLVAFEDIADPNSAIRVELGGLDETFGPGVELVSVTLEVTDDPVTDGVIAELLPWLETVGGGMLDGARGRSINAENQVANNLKRSYFKSTD